jgi:hypothetical protein
LYAKLGLQKEDEKESKAREEACAKRAPSVAMNAVDDDLVCGDKLSDEMSVLCDWRNPVMELESRYKDIATFRLAMRQFAIKSEFELGKASSPLKYRGYCKGGDCPWSIHARPEVKGSPTIIVCYITSQISFYVIQFQ